MLAAHIHLRTRRISLLHQCIKPVTASMNVGRESPTATIDDAVKNNDKNVLVGRRRFDRYESWLFHPHRHGHATGSFAEASLSRCGQLPLSPRLRSRTEIRLTLARENTTAIQDD